MQIGDVVQLRSGGVAMLVTRVLPGGRVLCTWTGPGGDPVDYVFLVACLTLIQKGLPN